MHLCAVVAVMLWTKLQQKQGSTYASIYAYLFIHTHITIYIHSCINYVYANSEIFLL